MSYNSNNGQQLYGFTSPLTTGAPAPIVSQRSPSTSDYSPIGSLWINTLTSQSWILVSIAAGVATWNLMEAGGAGGVFGTLTSSNTTTLATTAGSTVNTFGNTTGSTSLALSVGTGGFTLNGVGGSAYTIGAATTTGAINIGGTAQTGNLVVGSSTGVQTVTIAGGSGAGATFIANTQTGGSVSIGGAMTTGTVVLGGPGGLTKITPDTATSAIDTATLNANQGKITFTGFTTAAAGQQAFTITNSKVSATSSVQLTVTNTSTSGNAFMGLQGVVQSASTLVVNTVNNASAQALDGNVIISFSVNS